MRQLLALASSAAVLVGCYVTLSAAFPPLGLIAWISLVSAGAYFTAGGGVRGMTVPMTSGTLAILLTIAALYGVEVAGGGLAAIGALVAALAFTIVMLSRIPLLPMFRRLSWRRLHTWAPVPSGIGLWLPL
jgi:Protein of unknown function (DUF1097)